MVKRIKNNGIMKERTIKTVFDDPDLDFGFGGDKDSRNDFEFIMDYLEEVRGDLVTNLISQKERDIKKICESGDEKVIQGLYDAIHAISDAIYDAKLYIVDAKNRVG